MPSLRTKVPGFPHYAAQMRQSLSVSGNYVANMMGLGPVMYLPMMELLGSQAVDASGHGLNSTYNSCTLANRLGPGASMGSAPYFDGIVSLVQLPAAGLNGVFDPEQGSLSLWAYLNEAWSIADFLTAAYIGTDANNRLGIYKGTSVINAFRAKGSVTYSNTLSVTTAVWHHFVLTWSGNSGIMYADGVATPPFTTTGTWSGALTNNFTRLGTTNAGGGSFWKGWLQHAAFWNRALTPSEITIAATAV